MRSENNQTVSVPCWANFPVIFPLAQEVTVKVQYIQVGSYGEVGHGTLNFVTLSYILFTGAGWKDTIGSADIIARFPTEAKNLSLYAQPKGAVFSGKEVCWHFENIEPDFMNKGDPGRIKLTFLQPKYWFRIQAERASTSANPNDGEAWGRWL